MIYYIVWLDKGLEISSRCGRSSFKESAPLLTPVRKPEGLTGQRIIIMTSAGESRYVSLMRPEVILTAASVTF